MWCARACVGIRLGVRDFVGQAAADKTERERRQTEAHAHKVEKLASAKASRNLRKDQQSFLPSATPVDQVPVAQPRDAFARARAAVAASSVPAAPVSGGAEDALEGGGGQETSIPAPVTPL